MNDRTNLLHFLQMKYAMTQLYNIVLATIGEDSFVGIVLCLLRCEYMYEAICHTERIAKKTLTL